MIVSFLYRYKENLKLKKMKLYKFKKRKIIDLEPYIMIN